MNFNKEFGYPYWRDMSFKFHRYKPQSARSRCSNQLLWEIYFYVPPPTILSDICKKCLSTFSEEEIEDLKQYLINKKLGVKV